MAFFRTPLAALLLFALGAAVLIGPVGCSNPTDPADEIDPSQQPPKIQYFTASKDTVRHGDWATLRWAGTGEATGFISPDIGPIDYPNQGGHPIRPYEKVTYTYILFNDFGRDSAQVTVDVQYYVGVYVDAIDGDDSRSGDSPQTAFKTFAAARDSLRAGGTLYLSAGTYPDNLLFDAFPVRIFGGLDPVTFFHDPSLQSRFEPASGVPLEIRDIQGPVVLSGLTFEAPSGAEVAADFRNVRDPFDDLDGCVIQDCRFLGLESSSGIGLRIREGTDARIERSWIRGGRTAGLDETAGVSIEDDSDVLLANCFIDGGRADEVSSGVLVDGTGIVGIGLNTICGEIEGSGGSQVSSTAIRIRSGSPSIGGNILFTQGGGNRFGVFEEGPNCDPANLFGNLFVALGVFAYRNYPEGDDPRTEADLNSWELTTGDPDATSDENVLNTGASPSNLFRSVGTGDFHLEPVLMGGDPNPAIDGLITGWGITDPRYGGVHDDIDGQNRPNSTDRYDLGADEL